MKYSICFILLLLCGCSINFDVPKDYHTNEFYFKKKVKRIIVQGDLYYNSKDNYKTKFIDSIHFDQQNKTIQTVHNDFIQGCYDENSIQTSFFNENMECFASVYKAEDDFQLQLNNYKNNSAFIDSLIKIREYRKIIYVRWEEKKDGFLIKYISSATKDDSTTYVLIYKDEKLIRDIYTNWYGSRNTSYSDTMSYQYPRINKQIQFEDGLLRKEVSVYGNKTIIVRSGPNPTKSIYYSKKGMRKLHFDYENDQLTYKTVYHYSNGLISKVLHYDYKLKEHIRKTHTVPGKMWDGHDSVPKFQIHEYDSTYYNYKVKPDITTFKYTFEKN